MAVFSGVRQKPQRIMDKMEATSLSSPSCLYKSVVHDVVANAREAFLDEGEDEQVLHELKQLWLGKLQQQSNTVSDWPSEQESVLNMYDTNQPMLHKADQHSQIQQLQQLQQQRYHQQHQVQAQFPTAVLNSLDQVPIGGNNSSPGEGNSAVAPASSGAPSVQAATGNFYPHQLTALAGGGQVITTNTPQGPAQFLVPGYAMPQGQQVQLSPVQLQQIVQQQQAHQQQQQATVQLTAQRQGQHLVQLDGTQDSSSDENNDDDNDGEEEEEEEDPLNSDDDVSEEDPSELFQTFNIVACQYDKINWRRNKWHFHLKDGIMHLNGKDFIFKKANGNAEW